MSVEIRLKLPSGEEQRVTLPDNVEIGRLVPALVSKLALATVNDAGESVRYNLATENGLLATDQTLATAGVDNGQLLQLRLETVSWDKVIGFKSSSSSGFVK